MSDTIRWRVCFKHEERHKYGPVLEDCNMADALVIRADQDVYLIDEDKWTVASRVWTRWMKKHGVLMRIGDDT